MAIFITQPLGSQPATLKPGAQGQLVLSLSTDRSPAETAQIFYQIQTAGVAFTNTGTSTMNASEQVFSTGTTVRTPYGLDGPPGAVAIRAEARPGNPPSSSATVVVLTPAAARRRSPPQSRTRVSVSRGRASTRTTRARTKMSAKKKAVKKARAKSSRTTSRRAGKKR